MEEPENLWSRKEAEGERRRQELREALLSTCSKEGNGACGDSLAWLFSKNERALEELLRQHEKGQKDAQNAGNKDPITNSGLDWMLTNYDKDKSVAQTIGMSSFTCLALTYRAPR